MRAKWFAPHVAYTIAKYGMSMCVLAWPRSFDPGYCRQRALAAHDHCHCRVAGHSGAEAKFGRTPEIVAESAARILIQDSRATTGNFFIDEEVLARKELPTFPLCRLSRSTAKNRSLPQLMLTLEATDTMIVPKL